MPRVKKIRSYDASGRLEHARQSRERVIAVARAAFLERGYAGTTVAAIAEGAAVSAETIYKGFGGKTGLVRAIVERGLEGSGPKPAEARSDAISAGEDDPRAIVGKWGTLIAEVSPLVSPIMLLARSAAEAEPELASLLRDIDAKRLTRMKQNARVLERRGFLREGLGVDEAAEIMWTYASPELYDLLVVRRGWTPAKLGSFAADAMAAALLVIALLACGCGPAKSAAPAARSGVLATLDGSGMQIFADAEHVYAFERAGAGWSRLYRIRRSGGEPELIVDVSPFGRGLAFCGDRLVWSYADDGASVMTELQSTDKRVRPWRRGDYQHLGNFASGQTEPSDVTGDGTWVYWTSELRGDEKHEAIRRAACSGGPVADIATASLPVQLASAPGLLVYAESGDRLMLWREGTPPRELVRTGLDIVGLTTDGVDAYWLEGKDPTELHAISLTSKDAPRTIVKELDAARDLTMSPALICWSEPGAVLCSDRAHLTREPAVVATSEWGYESYIPFTLAPGSPSLYAYVDRNVVAFTPPFTTPRSPTRGNPLDPPFDATATEIRLRGIDLNRCLVPNGPTGSGHVTIVYEPNGIPSTLEVAPPFQNTRAGACIVGLYRSVHVAPFHGRPKMLKYSFVLPWI